MLSDFWMNVFKMKGINLDTVHPGLFLLLWDFGGHSTISPSIPAAILTSASSDLAAWARLEQSAQPLALESSGWLWRVGLPLEPIACC